MAALIGIGVAFAAPASADDDASKWLGDSGTLLQLSTKPTSFTFANDQGEVFRIAPDGKVTFGPGFTTTDEASRKFIEQIGAAFSLACKMGLPQP